VAADRRRDVRRPVNETRRSHMSAARQYELVYIVAPETSEQDLADLHTQIESIVTRFEGTIDNTEQWGRRKLAYDIGHHREGIYVLELITGSGDLMKEIDRRLKVIEHVIRHLVVRVDDEMRVVNRRKAEREAAVAARRAARGLPPEGPAETAAHPDQTGESQETEVNHE
jgi:small subunit ribosomal protein S6